MLELDAMVLVTILAITSIAETIALLYTLQIEVGITAFDVRCMDTILSRE
jgi:hypothetical protein